MGASDLSSALSNPALNPISIKKPAQHPALILLEKGKLQFALVVDREAEKHLRYRGTQSIIPAAELLQEAFAKCTGQQVDILDVNDKEKFSQYKNLFLLGNSFLTRELGMDASSLPQEGFELKTFAGGLALVGNDSSLQKDFNREPLDRLSPRRGTLHGAYDFIERFLGCRFFFPGEFGSLWPACSELQLLPCHYSDYPRFANRSPSWIIWTMMGEKNQKKWAPLIGDYQWPPKLPFQERWRLAEPEPFWAGHNPEPRALYKAYPEKKETIFYRAPNGNLYFNEKQHIGNYFDVTNLKFADLLVESLQKYYDSKGKKNDGWTMLSNSFIPFGQCDSGVPLPDMLTNPTVKELNLIREENISSGSAYSDIYGRFYHYFAGRLKTEFPGKKLLLLPYSNYTHVPCNPAWSFPDNIEVRVCIGNFPSRVRDPKVAAEWLETCKSWYEALGQRPIASLWLYNVPGNPFARAIAPQFVGEIPKLLGKYLGRQSLFLDQYGGLEWYYYYANYAASRSMWNPDFQVEAALAEHWVPFYGTVAGPLLQEFHALLLQSYMDYFIPGEDRNPLYPPAVIDRLEKLLRQAKESIAEGTAEQKRYLVFAYPWATAFESQRNRHSYERPVDLVSRLRDDVDKPLQIDGHLEEAIWQRCHPIKLRDPRGSNTLLHTPAKFMLAWNNEGIYGSYQISGAVLADDNKSIWNNCNIEMFFSPTMAREYMCHYVIDSINQRHSGQKQFAPVDQPYNSYWQSPGFKSAVQQQTDGWTVEFFLPFADLKTAIPKPYECWYANLVSNKNSRPEQYVGNSMTLGNNHNFEQYGLLKFLGSGD